MCRAHIARCSLTVKCLKFSSQSAINTLKNDNNIIIKEADKGGDSVIFNRDYRKLCEKDLDDNEYYEGLTQDLSKSDRIKYNKFIKKFKSCLTKKKKRNI